MCCIATTLYVLIGIYNTVSIALLSVNRELGNMIVGKLYLNGVLSTLPTIFD